MFGIVNEAFPPMEKLNEKQAKQVVDAITNLLKVNDIFEFTKMFACSNNFVS